MRDTDLTKLLGWPGYRVYRHEIDEEAKTLKLWVRRKRGQQKLVCSGCGRTLETAHDTNERIVEAINGNIKSLLRRGRGYRNLRYLL